MKRGIDGFTTFIILCVFVSFVFTQQQTEASPFIIRLVGGNGTTEGYGGDGGLAVNAQFSSPTSVYQLQSTRDIFIADYGNRVIRKIQSNGTVRTVSTGSITFIPNSVIASSTGDSLYVTDLLAHRILSINLSGGYVSLIAGPIFCFATCYGFSGDGGTATNARLNTPSGLSLSPDGSRLEKL